MLLNCLNFDLDLLRRRDEFHAWLEDSGLDSSGGDLANSLNSKDLLDGNSEWLLDWSLDVLEHIKSFNKCWAFVPWEVLGLLDEVVSLEP
jgi:hypothetical protein